MEAKPKEMRLGLIQLAVGAVKKDNLKRIITMVTKAASQGAQMVILPECCNSPFGNEYFPKYAESIPGESTETFSTVARDNKIYLVAGSIPERDNGILYNTSTVFDPKGEMIAKFRKMHMFDVDIPGKITFMESKTLNPGDSLATFDTPFCKVGLGICFDIRFPEFAQLYAKKGCDLLVFPAAFNMTTGPAHWELLVRARAVDNQLYVTNVSPARDETATYTAWGHTLMANPWGEVVAEAGTEESVVMVDMDLDFVSRMRQQIPLKRRYDVYELQDKQAAADS